jgi:transposase
MSKPNIARALDVSLRSVQDWIRIANAHGVGALRAKLHLGKRPNLTVKPREEIRSLRLRGAIANGFTGELWTGPRVAQLIRDTLPVTYHNNDLADMLQTMEFSRQKPERQTRSRAVAAWVDKDSARFKKRPGG